MRRGNKSILILIACICFAIAALVTAGVLNTDKINWIAIGLFFGFAAEIF